MRREGGLTLGASFVEAALQRVPVDKFFTDFAKQ